MISLKEKRILVMGAAGGIGNACLQALIESGANVFASDLPPKPDHIPCWYMPCNVSDCQQVDRLFHKVRSVTEKLDGFVYSAGLGSSCGFRDTSLEHFDQVLSVNLRGAFYSSQKAAGLMGAGGSIVLVASQKGLCGSTGSLAYNASTGGMVIMARSIALELGPEGIRVNCMCPGPTETPMFDADMKNQINESMAREKVMAANALHKISCPAQIASGILYLLSDEAGFVTGTELVADGGNIAGVRNI